MSELISASSLTPLKTLEILIPVSLISPIQPLSKSLLTESILFAKYSAASLLKIYSEFNIPAIAACSITPFAPIKLSRTSIFLAATIESLVAFTRSGPAISEPSPVINFVSFKPD